MVVVAGIDVSKATLDVLVSEGDVCRFNNTGKGISSLLKHIERQGVTKAVCESTGGYERLVVGKLREGRRSTCRWRIRSGCAHLPARVATRPRQTLLMPRYCLVRRGVH